jgi:hypothetical protein
MLLHEVFEKAPAAFLMFRDFLLQCRRQSAYLAYCEDSRDRDSQRKPFNIAVKTPRENERRLQCRVHETMLINRNENGFETHGGHQRTPPLRIVGEARDFAPFCARLAGERSARRCSLLSCKQDASPFYATKARLKSRSAAVSSHTEVCYPFGPKHGRTEQ